MVKGMFTQVDPRERLGPFPPIVPDSPSVSIGWIRPFSPPGSKGRGIGGEPIRHVEEKGRNRPHPGHETKHEGKERKGKEEKGGRKG